MSEDQEDKKPLNRVEALLRHHFAVVLAVVLGVSHYNGNVSWYFYTSAFGVSGFDNQDIYLTISIGFVIFVVEIFLALFVFLLRILVQIAISKFRKLTVQDGLRTWFQQLRAPRESISFWSSATYFLVAFALITPPLGALGYAEFNRYIVENDVCVRCVSVTLGDIAIKGKIVSSDTDRFAIYTKAGSVRIAHWDDVDEIESNSFLN